MRAALCRALADVSIRVDETATFLGNVRNSNPVLPQPTMPPKLKLDPKWWRRILINTDAKTDDLAAIQDFVMRKEHVWQSLQ